MSDLRARREAIVREHIRCERLGTDIDGAVATFFEGRATYDVVPLEHLRSPGQEITHPRPEDVHALLTELTTAFPDLELVVEKLHHADDAVIVEGRTTGTHRAPFFGLDPTGRRISVRAAVFYRFDGDRMTNETIYFDLATQMRQLGLESMPLTEEPSVTFARP
jgi:steroid delta-isomerase-like uncharacterized protein